MLSCSVFSAQVSSHTSIYIHIHPLLGHDMSADINNNPGFIWFVKFGWMDSGVRERGRLHRGSGLGASVEKTDREKRKSKVKGRKQSQRKRERWKETKKRGTKEWEGKHLCFQMRLESVQLAYPRDPSQYNSRYEVPSRASLPRPRFAICSSMASKPARQTLGDP
jgi:hypothetical protein